MKSFKEEERDAEYLHDKMMECCPSCGAHPEDDGGCFEDCKTWEKGDEEE